MKQKIVSDDQCHALQRQSKPYQVLVGKGLYLHVSKTGYKSWRYRFEVREDGKIKESMCVIGRFPEMNLQQAIAEREKRRSFVKNGVSPTQANSLRQRPLSYLLEVAIAAGLIDRIDAETVPASFLICLDKFVRLVKASEVSDEVAF